MDLASLLTHELSLKLWLVIKKYDILFESVKLLLEFSASGTLAKITSVLRIT